MAAPRLSIVLPAYNEEGNIERAVRDAARWAECAASSSEVVVVDDGSRDGTAPALVRLREELGPRLVIVSHASNRGYGAALRDGFAAARGELVFYTDSDNQFDLAGLSDVVPLAAEWDAVLGHRVKRQDPPLRILVSGFFNRLTCVVFGLHVRDINCSFKLFRGDVLRSLRLESNDFFIDAEMAIQLQRGGFRVVQHGVPHFPRTAGRSSVRPRDVFRTLVAIARMWRRIHFPGAVLEPS